MSKVRRWVRDDLADAFVSAGVDTGFGLIGDANLAFMSELARRPGFRLIHARHEAGAVFMAAGYARAAGRVGLASVTSGPGLAHCLTPLVSACRARVPLVLYAGDTGSTGVPVGGLQQFDHRSFAALAGAAYVRLDAGADPVAGVAEAIRIASGTLTPVLLSVPDDGVDQPSWHTGRPALPRPEVARATGAAPGEDVDRVVAEVTAALGAARQPVIVAGSGAVAAGVLGQLEDIAELADAYLATTFRANGAFESSPRSLGVIGALAHAAHQPLQDQADLIVGFGANLHGFGAFVDQLIGAPTLCLGAERFGALGPAHAPGCGREVDVAAVTSGVLEQVRRTSTAVPHPRRAASKSEAIAADFAELAELDDAALADPRRAMLELDALIPADCTVVVGGGHFWSFPMMYLPRRSRELVFPIEFGSIGMALPTGIGVAAAAPDREVVVIEGDGGVASSIQEIETAVRHGLRLTLIVLNDGALGAEYHKMTARGIRPDDSAYDHIRFDKVAEAFGAVGHLVRNAEDARALAATAAAEGRMPARVIDVRTSREITSRWYRRLYLGQIQSMRSESSR